MSQAADHKDVRQLGTELVVELGVLAFLVIAEVLGLLARVGGEERSVVGVLAHGQCDEALFGQFKFATLGDEDFGRYLGLGFTHGFVVVDRQVADCTAALRTDDVGAPAVLGKALGQTAGKGECCIAPQEVLVTATDAFVVTEGLGWNRILAIGRAQQKVR
ncbi:hypothetical protein D3C78_730230 [compost metagenome]